METSTDNWLVQLLKCDEAHWPDIGMPKLGGFYYDPDTPGLGIPEWLASFPKLMRDDLQLDRMYTPFSPGRATMTYEKNELDDLRPHQGNCHGKNASMSVLSNIDLPFYVGPQKYSTS